jgi:hypothetical protein
MKQSEIVMKSALIYGYIFSMYWNMDMGSIYVTKTQICHRLLTKNIYSRWFKRKVTFKPIKLGICRNWLNEIHKI